ncbi:protein trichome berefringence-like 7 [Sesamum alatum]|uniref:Protein trichome berefringence-like 7 n=1 Tax=Sesamum alatum TaxID=300844 RepID=A0AAE1YGG1_9LAMI|nr:protein trichome berefringence-like 7 [Sesamum alatum]
MRMSGCHLDPVAVIIGLGACSHICALKLGKEIHGLAIRNSSTDYDNVKNALITLYCRCGDLMHAYIVFTLIEAKDIISWNSIISGFARWDRSEEATFLFRELLLTGIEPNYVTLAGILPLCARVANLQHGKEFHCYIARREEFQGYLKWRWKLKSCEIPRFDVHAALELLRGKRVVFVGDSLSRTQWESMICMLMSVVEDKNSVYEVNGNEITKQIGHLAVRFRTFNFTVEFYRSVFLVQPGPVPKYSPKIVKTVLKLDQLDDINREWIDSDILIFNSGHWWTTTKLFEM